MSLFIARTCLFLLMFCGTVHFGFGQKEILSLQQIQSKVQENYPLVKGIKLLEKHSDLSIENIKTNYLPKLYASGKMSYQSDVTSSPLQGANSFGAPKDQYSINFDVEQLIYNGGRIQSQLKLTKLTTEIDIQDLEVKMFALREQVNNAFFSILLLRQSKDILNEKRKVVNESLKQVSSAVRSGVMASANAKVLEAEILLIDQQTKELESTEDSAYETLAELMNRVEDFDIENVNLMIESEDLLIENVRLENRPEYQLYKGQKLLLDEKIEFETKDRMPIITAFGQLGYGQPGYNQLNDEFDSYYMIGAKLSWNIFDWKSSKRNQRKYSIQKELIESQESSFQKKQRVELKKELSNISKFQILITQDDAIVDLQQAITKSSLSQLKNGIITSSDYLEDLNKETQAKLNRDYHRIQLSQAIAEYNRILGITEKR